MRRGGPFASGLAVTVLLHASAAVAIVLGHERAPPPPPPQELLVARLVRLGTPRPPQLLPRKPIAAPPAPVAVPVVAPAPEPATKPEEKSPTAADRADLRSAMARARALAARNAPKGDPGDAEPEGRPEGTPEGTADTAAEGDAYATEVYRRIHDGWRVPETVPARDLPRLRAVVFLRLADDGRIIEHRLVESSGNRFFDASALEAVQRVDRLPPPPPTRAAAILASGIDLEFHGAEAK